MPDPTHRSHGSRATAEVVLGVDTHKDVHVAAVLTELGALAGTNTFPTTTTGYQQLLDWARTFGPVRRAGVECTGSYGVALTRHLLQAGIEVVEVNQPDRGERRRRGKTDAVDAEAAARAVLSGRATTLAKSGDGPVEMLRMFRLAKDSATKSRTQAINQLKAVLVRADPALRDALSGLSLTKLVRRCAQLAAAPPADPASAAAYTLQSLAIRIAHLTAEIQDLTTRITEAIDAHTPTLLQQYGVGPDTAGALLLAVGDNPERISSEAAFAALCGVSPIEASSGKTQRRRLNRGGDRRANSALYTITIARLRWDHRTRTYVERRTSEGKTRREAIRCLKRYIARELYQLITKGQLSTA
ncbi:IS110 family transposase [Dactylosporangium sp. AC04546]|uniref:IS110 family transposase n=1 Tax=Dactylosporangium sp. AC04546 TaxID=2862460 RepID=UPI001EDEC934|nr:IS110 family transposase [Dactylosporangium sp. AC04546]WVK78986.1 IS110 family transposase [Dactylosporangium sp. AC04546]WVK84161.1 IS110 family transposase [Dactylosporangium sp. AC04546]WVK88859.1 IS110 family transposase [Dactylosporangium sp. AC04546]WVK89225.1 IS110 family transposase [Dactylosporangium sp. AC04546]